MAMAVVYLFEGEGKRKRRSYAPIGGTNNGVSSRWDCFSGSPCSTDR